MKTVLIVLCVIVFIIWIVRYLNPYKRIAKNIAIWYENIKILTKQKEKNFSLENTLVLTGILSQGIDVKQKKISIQTIKRIAEKSIDNNENVDVRELNTLLFFIEEMQFLLLNTGNTMNMSKIDGEILKNRRRTKRIIVKTLSKVSFSRLNFVQQIFDNYPEIWDGDYSNLLSEKKK